MAKSTNPPSIKKAAFDCSHCGAYTTQYWFELSAIQKADEDPLPHVVDKQVMERVRDHKDIPPEEKEYFAKTYEQHVIVRVIGNEAVHPGVIDLNDDRDTANKLFDLVNSIADQMISHPKNVKELWETLPETKKKLSKTEIKKLRKVVRQKDERNMPLSNYARDTFVAPNMSKLTSVGAPELHDQAKSWVNNFILNMVVRFQPDDKHRQLILRTLRSIEGAFEEYQEGREFLRTYVHKRADVSSYFHAL